MSRPIINILVVDDEECISTLLGEVLCSEGYFLEVAKTGKEALEISKKNSFDLSLVDIELPDIKGVDLVCKLKENQPKMATIIITGHPSIENAVKAVNQKVDAYLLKPFDIPKLLETIKKTLEEKRNSYFQMFTMVEQAKKAMPLFNYETPGNWNKRNKS